MKPFLPFIHALPVWPPKLAGRMNIWISLHASVKLSPGECATLRLAAAQAYRIWVNGEFAGRGPARTAHHYARVDEWPVQSDGAGNLRVIVEVMQYGVATFCSTHEPAFCCAELVALGNPIAWTAPLGGGFVAERRTERVQRVERYSYQRAFVEAYRVGRDGLAWREPGYAPARPVAVALVKYRRTWLPRGMAYPDFSVLNRGLNFNRGGTVRFSPALAAKVPAWPDPFGKSKGSAGFPEKTVEWPLFRTLAGTAFTTPGPARRSMTLKAREWLRADFRADHTGFPALRVKALKVTRLLLLFDEILVDGQVRFNRSSCVNAIWLELAKGAEIDFEAFEPYTLRFLQVLVWTGAAEVSDLHLRQCVNGTAFRPPPSGLAPSTGMVRRAALSSYRQNALDIFMDCPARERAGWLCDSLFTARAEWHLTGDNPIERAFLENYLLPKKFDDLPTGMVPMCYPAEVLNQQFIPNWAMFLIVELDEARRARRLPAAWQPMIARRVRGLLQYFRRFENDLGLLEKLESWVFVEWSKANEFVQDVNFPTNMLYAMTLRSAARLLGDFRLTAQAERIEATVRALAWRYGRFVDNAVRDPDGRLAVTDHASEVCQYYAFFTGVASPRREADLWRRLVQADYEPLLPANVFVGKVMRFELLIANGERKVAQRELLKYYMPMAHTTGTLWELFERNVSCNHGFTSYIALLIDRLAP